MCLTLNRDQCRAIVRNRGLISFLLYFAMVGLAAAGIFGKTQYNMSPLWVNVCMYGSLLCLILGLITACLVTTKEGGVNIVIRRGAQGGDNQPPSALPPEYQTQLQSPLLTVSVLDMECGLVHSTVPFFTYPVVDLQVLLPNRYGSREQVLGVHMPPLPSVHGHNNLTQVQLPPLSSPGDVTNSKSPPPNCENSESNNNNNNESTTEDAQQCLRRLHSISESPELRTKTESLEKTSSDKDKLSGDRSPPTYIQAMDLTEQPPEYTTIVQLPQDDDSSAASSSSTSPSSDQPQ